MPIPPGLLVDDPFDWGDGGSSEPSIQGPATDPASDERWKCARCFSSTFYRIGSDWFCSVCDNTEFVDSNRATRCDTSDGTWIFVPKQQQPPDSCVRSVNTQREMNGSPSDSGFVFGSGDFGENPHIPVHHLKLAPWEDGRISWE